MIQIPHLRARVFHRLMSNGRTRPCLFSCDADDGKRSEYVVKSYHQLRTGALKELIAALLGRELGLPIPLPALIDVSRPLIQSHSELASVFGEVSAPNFGSQHQTGGYFAFSSTYHSLSATQLPTAFAIFAWDMLIQNPDRRKENPNLLVNGDDFAVIDHELSLSFEQLIGQPPPPWELRGNPLATNHVLLVPLRVKSTETSFDRFVEQFTSLSTIQFETIVHAAPKEWGGEPLRQKILDHLLLVYSNAERFRQGLLEVMT